jgi:hypothetical protein
MTPREVIPAHIPEDAEREVYAALTQMVADEKRFSAPDPKIEKLKDALRKIAAQSWQFGGKEHDFCHPDGCDGPGIARRALEESK